MAGKHDELQAPSACNLNVCCAGVRARGAGVPRPQNWCIPSQAKAGDQCCDAELQATSNCACCWYCRQGSACAEDYTRAVPEESCCNDSDCFRGHGVGVSHLGSPKCQCQSSQVTNDKLDLNNATSAQQCFEQFHFPHLHLIAPLYSCHWTCSQPSCKSTN